MRSHRTIRQLLAGALLALFALGITPKIAIHALVAHHTDSSFSRDGGKADQYNKSGFHCATENLVVEFPFLDHSMVFQLGLTPAFPVYQTAALAQPIAKAHPLFGLRGPPSSFSAL